MIIILTGVLNREMRYQLIYGGLSFYRRRGESLKQQSAVCAGRPC